MVKENIKYIKRSWKKLIVFNFILFSLLYFIVVISLKLFFNISLYEINFNEFNHGYIIKKVSKTEENLFLKKIFNIKLNNKYAKFNNIVRIGISGQLKKKNFFSFGKEDFIYNYGFITFEGQFNSKNSMFKFLKQVGITEDEIEMHIKQNREIYYIKNCNINIDSDNNRFFFIIRNTLDSNQLSEFDIKPGKSIKSLEKQKTSLEYMWTVNNIIFKKKIIRNIFILVIDFVIILLVNFIIILFKLRKNKNEIV